MKEQYSTLFEQQSYRDALEYYLQTLHNRDLPVWDYCILTASNESQAKGYEMQIAERRRRGFLPERTQFAVLPDPGGCRVGSGGATLSCVRYVMEQAGTFEGKRVLVIHSGGDSKRIPQYSVCGKLFSPVPRLLPDGRRSSLFDEFLMGMSTVASRISEGMLVCSGDVLLLFNALQIDFYGVGAAALSIKESVMTGKDHGVYLRDEAGNVGRFLHKQSVESLRGAGAVDVRGNVDIDTGAVILGTEVLGRLWGLIDSDEKYHAYVNERARLSFYADFLYPLASGSTEEQYYREQPEGDFTEELRACRAQLWEALHGLRMKLVQLSPAAFIHFGTTGELLHLMTDGMEKFQFLDWRGVVNSNLAFGEGVGVGGSAAGKVKYAVSNSYVVKSAVIGEGSYIEDSRVLDGVRVGKRCVVSGLTLAGAGVGGCVDGGVGSGVGGSAAGGVGASAGGAGDRLVVPDGAVMHGLKLADGRFVCRMYGVDDNPKESKLFGRELGEALWTANIYPICGTIQEAVEATLAAVGRGCESAGCELISLRDSFNRADVTAILPWQENLYEQVAAEAVLEMIDRGIPAEKVKESPFIIDDHSVDYLLATAAKLDITDLPSFSKRIRIYAYLSRLVATSERRREMEDLCFRTIREATLGASSVASKFRSDCRLRRDVTINLPVRVNWGGGWSDTPPYCMENGGAVLNAALSINDGLPIETTVKRLDRPVIALSSTDIGSYKEFTDVAQLQDCRNPSDPFALHKAALIACGIVPAEGQMSMDELIKRLGGGMYMNTRVTDIPKGSGLGTSSILAGATVKALFAAMEAPVTDDEVVEHVLCLEQLMSTGGGWQDQVGGIAPGIKMIQTRAGIAQNIVCTPLAVAPEVKQELNDRFAIIYTGQRRLARNLLRDVVMRYICADPESLAAHYNIQRLAVLMRFELEKGNIDGFARLLTEHWAESQRLDAGSTNTCIDQIFAVIDDLVDGKMICGAGGGGFLQVILKRGITKAALAARLADVFQDSGVAPWPAKLV